MLKLQKKVMHTKYFRLERENYYFYFKPVN